MVNSKDIDKLKWIAKRLVHKYNEDPAIISFVNEIISKIEAESLTFANLSKQLKTPVKDAITKLNHMIQVLDEIPVEIKQNQKEILGRFHTDTFENLNVGEILGLKD
jgi:hypothetical protein